MIITRRILAVDPGDKRIGIAVSDDSGTIANPLTVLKHVARLVDAAVIANLAADQSAVKIIIGQALDDKGEVSHQGRKAERLAEAIRSQTNLPVELWDEAGSTQAARSARVCMGARRSKRSGHMDELAATVILQTYLDANQG
jgi:putative holliday junction resolvase